MSSLNYLNERLWSYFNVQQFYLTNFQNASILFRNIFRCKWYTELISKTLKTICYYSGNNISKITSENCEWRNFYRPTRFYSGKMEMKNNVLINETNRIADVLLLYLEISKAKMFKKKRTNTMEKFIEMDLFFMRQLSNSVPIIRCKNSQHSMVNKSKILLHDKQKSFNSIEYKVIKCNNSTSDYTQLLINKNSEKFYSNKIRRWINKLSNQSNLSHQDYSSDMTEIKILEDIRKRIDQDFEQLSMNEKIYNDIDLNIKKNISVCSINSDTKF
ncbi:hypothetical protein PV327_000338 [Microctonus hyperodae]|uniref:Uncharacterized protein n=1 Tax=Microctonus hyperodae TaxID=165561 RepID=A0AA39G715_MICHY|nr:hypothetical protein PV327_000338 [Microctonus hyperodae]